MILSTHALPASPSRVWVPVVQGLVCLVHRESWGLVRVRYQLSLRVGLSHPNGMAGLLVQQG